MKNVEVQVLVNGRPVKQFWHDEKFWVEARHGLSYEVRVKNNTARRVLAVVSIDGLDVLTGKSADSNSGGYIIAGYSSHTIKGFRVSDEEVNVFEFARKEQSYAAHSPTGEKSTANCGIIAVRVIQEKEEPIKWQGLIKKGGPVAFPDYPRRLTPWISEPSWNDDLLCKSMSLYDSEGPITASSTRESDWNKGYDIDRLELSPKSRRITLDAKPEFDTGTKFSETKVEDRVTKVSFERGGVLDEISIYYATRRALEQFGINFEPEPKVAMPQGFKDGYCQPPTN